MKDQLLDALRTFTTAHSIEMNAIVSQNVRSIEKRIKANQVDMSDVVMRILTMPIKLKQTPEHQELLTTARLYKAFLDRMKELQL